jgi:hypothetical protein
LTAVSGADQGIGEDVITQSDTITAAAQTFNVLLPLMFLMLGVWLGIGITRLIVKEVGSVMEGKEYKSPFKSKRKNEEIESEFEVEWLPAGELPKRKNDQIQLGDDGELVLPEHFQDRME